MNPLLNELIYWTYLKLYETDCFNQYKIKGKINADQMSDYCCK